MNKLKVLEAIKTIKTMSSLEIAELTGKLHKNVKRDLDTLYIELGDIPKCENVYNKQNQAVKVYLVARRECDLLMMGYSVTVRAKVYDRWIELEKKEQFKIPQTYSAALALASEQAKEIEEQKKSLEVKDTLIIASNEASIKAGDITIREFVKSTDIIEIGSNLFFKWMREQGFIFKESSQPYQVYVARGMFRWLPTPEKHGGKIRYQLFVTARGRVWLAAKYLKWSDTQ